MRDQTFDIMKGIGILSMVIGHSYVPAVLKDFIFTWHMPLFFIISGYFYKSNPNREYIKKNVRQLIVPYIVTAIVIIGFSVCKDVIKGEPIKNNYIIGALIGNGSHHNPNFGEYNIGAIWFLLALCWCRIIYNIMVNYIPNENHKNTTLIIMSCSATYIGTIVFIPTDLLQGLQALLFFHIGYLWRCGKIQKINPIYLQIVISCFLCILSISSGSMSMVRCYYGFFPVNILAAVCITVGMYEFCTIVGNNVISRFLAYCGRISLLILCVHNIELNCHIAQFLQTNCSFPKYSNVGIHLLISLVCSGMLFQIKFIRNLFYL